MEDELLARQVLQSHLSNMTDFEVVAYCTNTDEARSILQTKEVDLMFLDVQLPGTNGLDFLRTLQHPPLVILTTAYADYAVEGFELNVIDYLLKPISRERFGKSLKRVSGERLLSNAQREQSGPGHIFIKCNSKYFKVYLSEIVYVQAMKDYLKVFTAEFRLITHQTMYEMEKCLPPSQFMRVHRSYIISLQYLNKVDGNDLVLGKIAIPIGQTYRQNIIQHVQKMQDRSGTSGK